MSEEPVPRLDLAPRRMRPLAFWNPRDYLLLLYWAFFFPQAFLWYLVRFGDSGHPAAEGGRAVWQALRQDSTQSRLVVQSLVTMLVAAFSIGFALEAAGIPIELAGVAFGVVCGIGFGVAFGVVVYVPVGIAVGIAVGVVVSVVVGVVVGVAGDGEIGFSLSIGIGVGYVVAFSVAYGVVGGIALIAVRVFAFSVFVSVAFGVAFGVTIGVVFGVAFGVAFIVSNARLPDWLLMAPFVPTGRRNWWSRAVWIPLPGLQRQIEIWLERSWVSGLANVREILAHSLQFIPVVAAINGVLGRSSSSQLLLRAVELVGDSHDWNLVRFCSEDLGRALRREFISSFLIPRKWKAKLNRRYPAIVRVDTAARAACAGFWFWYKKDVESAAAAFEHVTEIRYGVEFYRIARSIMNFGKIKTLEGLAETANASTELESFPDPELRSGTLKSLRTLKSAAAEAAIARRSRAPLNRSAALGRATAAIDRLIEEGSDFCPDPEWALIRRIAEKWRRMLLRAGGAVGEEVLREPVRNPYEGYSGLPVTGTTFVGRRAAMHQIETRWATAELLPVLILFGHRRMGKTSILRHLEQAAPAGTLLVYLDMQDAGLIDHTGQLFLELAEAIHKRVAEAGLDVGPAPVETDYASLGTARRALNGLLARLDAGFGDRRLILAVDEFELIEKRIREDRIDADVLHYLRSLNQRHRWFALIFGGLHTLDEMGRDYQSAFYGQTEHIRVGYLDREDNLRLITQPHPDFALEYSDELLDELYRLTYGQPYLTQLLCWELVTRWNERFLDQGESTPRTLELEDLEPVIDADFFTRAEYYFDGVWSNVSEEERELMGVLAEREEGWPEEELVAASGRGPEEVAGSLRLLRRHDVTVEKQGRVQYASELLRRWVVERGER